MSGVASYYPQHDRTSCDDAHPVNAEAGGSHGCARCTALLLDQREELLAALLLAQRLCDEALPKFNWGASTLDANAIDLLNRAPVAIQAAIVKANGSKA